jgi:hypothetical protein
MQVAVTANELSDFMSFTYVFRHCRPKLQDYYVYEVDAGEPTDPNIFFRAMKLEDDHLVDDAVELVVSKEWILENIYKILEKVPQDS